MWIPADAYQFADDFAVTFYFSGPTGAKTVTDASIDELIQMQIDDQNINMSSTAPIGYQYAIAKEAISRGMRLVAYEGGTHLLPNDNNDPAQVDKLTVVNRAPRMKNVFLNALKLWQGLRDQFGADKVGVFNQYSNIIQYSKYGYWGQMEATYQDIATAPKHQAFIEWSKRCLPPGRPTGLKVTP